MEGKHTDDEQWKRYDLERHTKTERYEATIDNSNVTAITFRWNEKQHNDGWEGRDFAIHRMAAEAADRAMLTATAVNGRSLVQIMEPSDIARLKPGASVDLTTSNGQAAHYFFIQAPTTEE